MSATIISFRWLDLLEKEFDKSFVDIDLIIGEVDDVEDGEWIPQVRSKLGGLSSCFAQLAHKAQTIFQTNAKLEAELLNLRHELAELGATNKILKEENHDILMQLHASQLKLHNNSSNHDINDINNAEKIREKLERELEEERLKRLSLEVPKEELVLLKRENEMLKKYVLNLQGELSGAKLTSKYLDKELAGRIQQLQLLSRELKGEQHEKLWKQLESEIHLHRHKTVVRACRSNSVQISSVGSKTTLNGSSDLPKPQKTQFHRFVTLHRNPDQGLGMSITGGREHGVPILVSVLQSHLPAGACQQLFVGDAILSVNGRSLKDCTHSEAVDILSSLEGEITLEVVYVSPDEDDEASVSLEDPLYFKYRLFDDEVTSVTSSLHLLQNGRLSRASIDSIRGSTDNILESLGRGMENTIEPCEEVEPQHCNSNHVENELQGSSFPIDEVISNMGFNLQSDDVNGKIGSNSDDDIPESPDVETSHLIASQSPEKMANDESLKLIENGEMEKRISTSETPSLPTITLTPDDVFNKFYGL
ncbi:UNVERIFIED_CONTAM: hypothetical protein RMT77_007783 [Armadillidium vulgare]